MCVHVKDRHTCTKLKWNAVAILATLLLSWLSFTFHHLPWSWLQPRPILQTMPDLQMWIFSYFCHFMQKHLPVPSYRPHNTAFATQLFCTATHSPTIHKSSFRFTLSTDLWETTSHRHHSGTLPPCVRQVSIPSDPLTCLREKELWTIICTMPPCDLVWECETCTCNRRWDQKRLTTGIVSLPLSLCHSFEFI